jgi:hypothetical protein
MLVEEDWPSGVRADFMNSAGFLVQAEPGDWNMATIRTFIVMCVTGLSRIAFA